MIPETTTTTAIRSAVRQVLDALGGVVPAPKPGAPEGLGRWAELVVRWNQRVDLTAARSLEELVDLLVVDAAVVATLVDEGKSVVDVGTGAGAPGLGLAILRPDVRVTLVEPLAKRVAFLRTVVGTLRLVNVEVVRAKGEDLLAQNRAFDVAVSRATLAPAAWLALGRKLAPTGDVLVLLAKDAPPEAENEALADDRSYPWPLTAVQRRIVRYRPVRFLEPKSRAIRDSRQKVLHRRTKWSKRRLRFGAAVPTPAGPELLCPPPRGCRKRKRRPKKRS